MITHLRGTIVRSSPAELVVDVGGVGYQVSIPLSTFTHFEHSSGEITILTHLHIREDAMQLYGFATESERDLFRLLISVSGIGPRMAQGILSGMGSGDLREAILSGNIGALTAIQGVGKKTAERLIMELKEKVGKGMPEEVAPATGSKDLRSRAEAVVALMSLGFTRQGAERTLQEILSKSPTKDLSLEDLIKQALRRSGA
jgi:Holliday junction DNA helicase RuvA